MNGNIDTTTLREKKPPVEGPVTAAALWLRRQHPAPRLAVLALKERFQLNAIQACQAIALARGLDVRRASE